MATLFPYQTGQAPPIDKSPDAMAKAQAQFNSPEYLNLKQAFISGNAGGSGASPSPVFYDKTTWKPYDDQSRYSRVDKSYGLGADWSIYQMGPFGDSYAADETTAYGDPFKDYLKEKFAVSPKTQQWLGGLQGIGVDDVEKGIKSYFDQTGDNWDDFRWWGDDAKLRAIGTGMDTANPNATWKGSWQPNWNRDRELGQQKQAADQYHANEAAMGSDLGDFLSAAKGFGLILGGGGLANSLLSVGSTGLNAANAASLADAYGVTGSSLGGQAAGLSGVAGAEAASLADAYGVTGASGGATDIPWGVNPQEGGNMLDLFDSWNPVDLGQEILPDISNVFGNDVPIDPFPWETFETYPDVGLPDAGGPPGGSGGGPDTVGSDWSTGDPGSMNPGNPSSPGTWQGQLDNFMRNLPNLPPGVSSVIRSIFGGGNSSNTNGRSLFGTALGGLLQYLNGQSTSQQYNNLMNNLLNQGNPLNAPQRQPFIQAATSNIPMGNYLQNYGSPVANFYSERLNPAVAKSGDLTNSLAANQNGFAREIMGEYNKTLGTLGSLGGLTQQNNALGVAGQAGASGVAASNAGTAAGMGAIGNAAGQVLGGIINNQNTGNQTNPVSGTTTIWDTPP